MGAYADESRLSFYRARVAACPAPSPAEEAALAQQWRLGDQRAGARLVEGNLRHVLRIAQDYRRWGVNFDDLVQQGNIGLLKAAQRFDEAQGVNLRTYASYWIRAEIRDYVVRCYRIVRLGATRTERRALRAYRTSAVQSVEELAQQSGMPLARCQLLWPLLAHGDRSLENAGTGGTPGRDLLRDGRPDPEALAIAREGRRNARDRVQRALSALSERERRIVWARLATEQPPTLEQLGKRLGVSRERVRQLESRARHKLREALSA
jgi:RNA polymerase sigma-32 factor